MIFGHRPTQTDTDISVPRLAGLKESSHSRVKNPLIWSLQKGSTFCFAIVGKAKSLCVPATPKPCAKAGLGSVASPAEPDRCVANKP